MSTRQPAGSYAIINPSSIRRCQALIPGSGAKGLSTVVVAGRQVTNAAVQACLSPSLGILSFRSPSFTRHIGYHLFSLWPASKAHSIDQPFPYTDPSASSTTRDELTSFDHDVEDVLLDCDAEIARVEDMLRLLKQERQAGESFLHLSPQLLRKGNLPGKIFAGRWSRTSQPTKTYHTPGRSFIAGLPGFRHPLPCTISLDCSHIVVPRDQFFTKECCLSRSRMSLRMSCRAQS